MQKGNEELAKELARCTGERIALTLKLIEYQKIEKMETSSIIKKKIKIPLLM